MSERQQSPYDNIARRWLVLVERRQQNFIELCNSGRWYPPPLVATSVVGAIDTATSKQKSQPLNRDPEAARNKLPV